MTEHLICSAEDGLTHINIFSKGKTPLGRFLSNFTRCDIRTTHGRFASIEAVWYWLKFKDSGMSEEDSRTLMTSHGYQAKKLGREYAKKYEEKHLEAFNQIIENCIRQKIRNNPEMQRQLRESVLPFSHYYSYQGRDLDAGHHWLPQLMSTIRAELQSTSPQ